jgi:hypothetical protein
LLVGYSTDNAAYRALVRLAGVDSFRVADKPFPIQTTHF